MPEQTSELLKPAIRRQKIGFSGTSPLQASSYHFLSNVYLYLGETGPSRHLIDTKTEYGYNMNKMLTRLQNWFYKNILHYWLTKFGIVMMCG